MFGNPAQSLPLRRGLLQCNYMKFSIGIVGLPNVGKSTLFKALTKKQVDTSNYPFCTIDPNVGVVAVPDERLDKLVDVLKPEKVIPTTIEFVDIAGLVAGAHKGEGLGNQFLSHIREVKAIVHIVRAFKDKNVSHVAEGINLDRDIKIVELELILADLALVDKGYKEVAPKARTGEKEAKELLPVLEKIKGVLEQEKPARLVELNEEEQVLIKELNLLTLKPVLYVLNVGEDEMQRVAAVPEPQPGRHGDLPYAEISICAKLEAELTDLSAEEAQEYMKEVSLKELGLNKLIKVSYKLLDLITFFTTESNILQAWTVKKGTPTNQAAGVIHTDFEEKFIKAEVIFWQDLVDSGSMQKAREQGLARTEGKDYLVQDGDVMHIRI